MKRTHHHTNIHRFTRRGPTGTLCLATLLAAVAARTAQANSSLNPTDPALGYNAFVESNLTGEGGHSEGPVALGGNLTVTGNGYNPVFGNPAPGFTYKAPGDSTVAGLVIGGKITSLVNQIGINQPSYIKLGDPTGYQIWATDQNGYPMNTRITPTGTGRDGNPNILLNVRESAASVTGPSGINFTDAFSTMAAYSQQMANWAVTYSPPSWHNQVTLPLASSGVSVFTLTTAELSAVTLGFSQTPNAQHPVVLNVDSSASSTFNVRFTGLGDTAGSYILLNFYNANGTLTWNNAGDSMDGTLFAPTATVDKENSNNLNGQLIAENFTQNGGELHYHPFSAALPLTSVPEPRAFALTAGVGLLGFGLWRKSRAKL